MGAIVTPNEGQYHEWLKKTIHNELGRVVEEEFETAKKAAIEKIEKRKGEIIAGVVLYAEGRMRMQDFAREMIITVEKREPSE